MHELRDFIQGSLATAHVPGFAIAVVKGDAVVFAGGFGQRDREADLPVARDELVRRLRYLVPSRDLRQAWQYQNLMYAAAGYLVVMSGAETVTIPKVGSHA